MTNFTKPLLLTGLGAFLLTTSATAQNDVSAEDNQYTVSQEKGDQVLKELAETFKNDESFKVEILAQVISGQMKQNVRFDTAMMRPNKFYRSISVEGEMQDALIVDGETKTLYIPAFTAYEQSDAPDTVSEVVSADYASEMTLQKFLLSATPYEDVKAYYDSFELVEVKSAENEGTNYIYEYTKGSETGTLTLTKEADGDVKPIQMSGKEQGVTVSMEFLGWEEEATDADFAWAPPEGVKKVDSIRDEAMKQQQAGAPKPKLGDKAPEFTLTNREGQTVNLSDHKGKDVVILDFWATWCGPCRQGLPALAEIAKDYEGQNLKFYAINLRESPEQIAKFMESQEIPFEVLLDKDGSVGQQYETQGIPHTVIVGKDGIIQAVHIGFNPQGDKLYREEVDQLLAGESLVSAD